MLTSTHKDNYLKLYITFALVLSGNNTVGTSAENCLRYRENHRIGWYEILVNVTFGLACALVQPHQI